MTSKIDKEVLEKHSFILDDLSSNGKKIKFLETLLPKKQEEKKDFEIKSKWSNPWTGDRYEVLKDKVKTWKVTPAERWEYLQLLRTKK